MTVRALVRGTGETLITLGIVVLLFVAYELWWTNVVADRAVAAQTSRLLDRFDAAPHASTDAVTVVPGQAFALMYIPALGARWSRPVIQGVTLDDLARGVGHYPRSALPGQVGNFAVAGHRATNGQPFAFLDRVTPGDEVILRTQAHWYVYRVTATSLVAPTDLDVIDPVPGASGAVPHQRLITLTTCNPRWASYQRLVVHGVLVTVTPAVTRPPGVSAG